jgi:hypothetical protein
MRVSSKDAVCQYWIYTKTESTRKQKLNIDQTCQINYRLF